MLFHIVIPRENLETEYFSKYIVLRTVVSVYIMIQWRRHFFLSFDFYQAFSLNYKLQVNKGKPFFVSMFMFIITVWKVCRNKILKSKVVFNVLIYTVTALVIVMICCNLKILSIQNSPDTIEQAISPDLHVVGTPEHSFNDMKNLIIGYF